MVVNALNVKELVEFCGSNFEKAYLASSGTEATETDNGMSGYAGNASYDTRFHMGPLFLDLGSKAGYMRTKEVAIDAADGKADHTFIFASGIASVGLSFNLSK